MNPEMRGNIGFMAKRRPAKTNVFIFNFLKLLPEGKVSSRSGVYKLFLKASVSKYLSYEHHVVSVTTLDSAIIG